MTSNEESPKKVVSQFKDLIENAYKLAGLIAAVVATITFASGSRLTSYVFILIACASIDWFLWRVVSRRVLAATAILAITTSSVAWIGVNVWKDYRGILFPPAKPDELLLIVAQFDERGGPGMDPTTRIVDRLNLELEKANIQNARIEVVPKIKNENTARQIGQVHQAIFVIWGWYDAFGFNPHFTIVRKKQQPLTNVRLPEVATGQRAFDFYIREQLPAQMTYFAIFTIGQIYYLNNKIDEALRAFDRAQTTLMQGAESNLDMSSLSTLYLYRGLAYEARFNRDPAIAAFTKAIELDPKFADAYRHRGTFYGWIGNFDQSIADLTKAISLDPTSKSAYSSRGTAYRRKGKFDLAIDDFNRAIGRDAASDYDYYERGIAFYSKGNLDQAILDFTKAIDLGYKYAEAYGRRGIAYRDKGNLDQAGKDFTAMYKSVNTGLLGSNFSKQIGMAFRKSGLKSLAIDEFELHLRLHPNSWDAREIEQWLRELRNQ